MLEQNVWATIRQLPDGEPLPGQVQGREEQRLWVTVPPGVENTGFPIGALLEVQSEQFLYLGVVAGWLDSVMVVAIEHAMDRTALAEIHDVWHGSRES